MIAILRLVAGLVIWAGVFSLVYALHGVGCEGDWAARRVAGISMQRAVLIAAWLAGSAATLALAIALQRGAARGPQVERQAGPMVERAGVIGGWVAFAATLGGGLPILIIPACL